MQRRKMLRQPVDDSVVELVEDDDPLGRDTTLTRVAQPGRRGLGDRAGQTPQRVEIEDDERVASAKLQNTLLQVPARQLADDRPDPITAGERDTLDGIMSDDPFDICDVEERIGVDTQRSARIPEKLLDGQRGLWTDLGMLHQHHIPGHQLRSRDSSCLVQREVPRLDGQHNTQRLAHDRGAVRARQQLRFQEARPVLGEISQDSGHPRNLATTIGDRLAHLKRLQPSEVFLTLHHQLRSTSHHLGARSGRPAAPNLKSLPGRLQYDFKSLPTQKRKVPQMLPRRRIHTRVSTLFDKLRVVAVLQSLSHDSPSSQAIAAQCLGARP